MKKQSKAVIFLADGMADDPQSALGGKTPLEFANTPGMDEIARTGINVQKGQEIILNCPVEYYEFGRLVIEELYAAGNNQRSKIGSICGSYREPCEIKHIEHSSICHLIAE